MLADYSEHKEITKLLFFVLEDYTSLFSSFLMKVVYPENNDSNIDIKTPESFKNLIDNLKFKEEWKYDDLDLLLNKNSELIEKANSFIQISTKTKQKLPIKNLKEITDLYDFFILNIRYLEKKIFIEDIGIDIVSGLRSSTLLFDDIEIEMQRFERHGKGFCIVFAKIDDFDKIQDYGKIEIEGGYVKKIAGLIKKCLRVFDEAYYLGKGEFVLSLKQTEISGGIAALNRLRDMLENKKIIFEPNNMFLTMSCCLVDPVIGDDVKSLIKNLRADLIESKSKKDNSVILAYRELSPLQRYVKEGEA